ncbi:MAG: FHA domain-containing protein [Planctomycetes bacterium]|nr:FHA domain-containing protein [Planctomycetota bacterium]
MRVVIDHKSGSHSGQREVFERESVLIGRGQPNDVALDPFRDPTVSAQHAEIRFEDAGYVLYDMGSLNGTYLNGAVVRRASLNDGDEIGLGLSGPRLTVSIDGAGPRPARVAGERGRPASGSTSLEQEQIRFDEPVVSRSPALYIVIGVLVVALVALLFWWLGSR